MAGGFVLLVGCSGLRSFCLVVWLRRWFLGALVDLLFGCNPDWLCGVYYCGCLLWFLAVLGVLLWCWLVVFRAGFTRSDLLLRLDYGWWLIVL